MLIDSPKHRPTVVAVIGNHPETLVRFRLPLMKEWVARGAIVYAFAPNIKGTVAEQLGAEGIAAVDFPLTRHGLNPLKDLQSTWILWRQLKRLRPDVVLAYTIKPIVYGLPVAALARVPRRFAMIEGAGYAFTSHIPRLGERALRHLVTWLFRFALSFAQRVFFLNTDDLALFVQRRIVLKAHSTVLPGGIGVDVKEYQASLPRVDPITFVLVARLLREKGIREFVAAAALVRRARPAAKLEFVLVGGIDTNPGALKQGEVESWVSQGHVSWRGQVNNVVEVLNASSVFVLPSYREGIPRSTMEALACGRAVITTDAVGCRETVQHGVNGLLVPVRDAAALSAAMLKLVDEPDLIVTMGLASRIYAVERFSLECANQAISKEMGL